MPLSTFTNEMLQPFQLIGGFCIGSWLPRMMEKFILSRSKRPPLPLSLLTFFTVCILVVFEAYGVLVGIIMAICERGAEILWRKNKYAASLYFLLIGTSFTIVSIGTLLSHKIISLILMILCFLIIRCERRIDYFMRVMLP